MNDEVETTEEVLDQVAEETVDNSGLDDFAPDNFDGLTGDEEKLTPTEDTQPEEEQTETDEAAEETEGGLGDKEEAQIQEEAQGDESPVPTFEVDGVSYPMDQIPLELLQKMKTHYGQVGHYQKLYEDAKAGLLETQGQQAQQQGAQQTGQQQPQEPLTPDTLSKAYEPILKMAQKEGWVGEFLVEEDPAFVSVVANNINNVQKLTGALVDTARRNQMLEERLAQIENRFKTEEVESVSQRVASTLDKIADESEFFAPLKNAETRNKLFESWGEMFKGAPNAEQMENIFIQNLLGGDLEGGLRRLAAGYLTTSAEGAFKKASDEVKKASKKRRARTVGEKTSSPAAAPARKAKSDNGLDDFAPGD